MRQVRQRAFVSPNGIVLLLLVSLVLSNTAFSSIESNRSQIVTTPSTPLVFEQNLGQYKDAVIFAAKGGGYSIILGEQPIIELYRLRTDTKSGWNDLDGAGQVKPEIESFAEIRLDILGARKGITPTPLSKQQTLKHYLVGSPSEWHTNVPNFERIRYSEILPGIDVEYYGADGRLEYDFVVKPGADPKAIGISYEGAENVSINTAGDLVLDLGHHQIIQRAPYTFQWGRGGEKIEVASAYTLKDEVIGFEVASFDREKTLVIDPVLEYSRYYGGASFDQPYAVDLDASGNIYVIAASASVGMATPGAYGEGEAGARQEVANYPWCDDCTDGSGQVERINIANERGVLVTKFSPNGQNVIWSAFVNLPSGWASLGINSAAVSDTGEIAFGINDAPAGLPLVSETQVYDASQRNAYVAKLNSGGSGLVFATYLNLGGASVTVRGLDVSAGGEVAVTGGLGTGNTFPVVTGIPGQSCTLNEAGGEWYEGYVALFGNTGTLTFSSCLGGELSDGSSLEYLRGVAIDNGDLYVVGYSSMTDFPVVNPTQATKNVAGAREMTISQIDPDTGALVFSTWFGPTAVGNAPPGYDYDTHTPVSTLFPLDIRVDSGGNIIVTGTVPGLNYPTFNALQPNLATPRTPTEFLSPYYDQISQPTDYYVTKLHPDNGVVFSTYLGGSRAEANIPALALDADDNIYLLGISSSTDYPVLNAIQSTLPGEISSVLSKITPAGALAFSTYLGGNEDSMTNLAGGVTVNAAGKIILAVPTGADDFPIVGSETSYFGGGDIALAIIDQSAHIDTDGDGVPDAVDDFPADDSEWIDTDDDLTGDNTDTDDDDDGEPDATDRFPLDSSETVDSDGDGAGDNRDEFDADLANYFDLDEDGLADFDSLEDDIDDDGSDDNDDQFDFDASETTDSDRDGIGDNSDNDDDGDLTPDLLDLEPLDFDIPIFTFERYNAHDTNLFKSPWPEGFEDVVGADAAWTSAEDQSYSGSRSFSSRIIDHGQVAAIKRTDTFPDGVVEFRYKVDSQDGADLFTFSIDAVTQLTSSGDTGWQLFSIPITAGAHTLEWHYTKDGTISEGDDAAWIDDFFVRTEAGPTEHFVSTWQTDNLGTSNSTSITVPMVGGPYDVDWDGDGVFDQFGLYGVVTHNYGVAGTYTIRIQGAYDSIKFQFYDGIYKDGDQAKILSLDQWGTNSWVSMEYAFGECTNLTIPATDIPDLSAVESMQGIFELAIAANPDTSGWDASAVTDMSRMFHGASSANPDTSSWDTSAVTNMYLMFSDTTLANPDTSGWDTSAVTNMSGMFYNATSANPDTSGWDTSSVTGMSRMFEYTTIANPDTSGWDTAAVTDMSSMFSETTLANPDTSGWDTSAVTDMKFMFSRTTLANPDTSGWDTSAVTDMLAMFQRASSANPDTSGWDTSKVTGMGNLFFYSSTLNPDTSGWDTSSVTDMSAMFAYSSTLNPDTSGWDTSSVTDMEAMFYRAASANPDTSGWDTAAVTDMRRMFKSATSANPDTSAWETGAVTSMYGMFHGATSANPNTTGWDTSAVTDMHEMFYNATSANPDTSSWDTSAVSDMNSMFLFASSAKPDVSGWDTAAVTDMAQMFWGVPSFDQNIGSWDVTSLTNALYMFENVTLSTANYDSLLIGWNAQALQPGVTFSGGNSNYCSEAAAAARANMIASDSWVITDGGEACPPATPVVAPDLTPGTDSGVSNSDDITTDSTPRFYVVCSAIGNTITLYTDNPTASTKIGTRVCKTVGTETATVTTALTIGVHNITYTDKIGGAESGQSPSLAITIDPPVPSDDFVTTWQTGNSGVSNSTSITVPMVGGPYQVDWDNDGEFDEFGLTDAVTHDYGVAGRHIIRIRGTYESIRFANGGDKEKILSLDQWGTNSWTSMGEAFYGASNLTVSATDTPDFSAVIDMSRMFRNATLANPGTSGWDTSSVTNMGQMFSGLFFGAMSANPDTSGWDTSAVTNLNGMFALTTSANPDTSGWDTSAVTNMAAMFWAARSANPNTSDWDTSAVTSMASMFNTATSANPDVSGWDTSSVTIMNSMFSSATSANPDISGWDTSAVTDMVYMFYAASAANPDTSNWNVTALTDATDMFTGVTLSLANYENLLTGWNAQTLQPGVNFSGGNSTYCSVTAAVARASMVASDSWAITDGGKFCPPGYSCNVNMVSGVTEYSDISHEACEILVLGPDFMAADGANVSANSGWEIEFLPGFIVEPGATFKANVCGQSLCMTSDLPMPYGCHSCVDQICGIDPSCCNTAFDQSCLNQVDTVCGLVCE
jgi:surface protein